MGTGIEARDVTLKPEEDDEEAAVLGLATAGAVALDVRAAAASAVACAASSALAFVANCAAASVALMIAFAAIRARLSVTNPMAVSLATLIACWVASVMAVAFAFSSATSNDFALAAAFAFQRPPAWFAAMAV